MLAFNRPKLEKAADPPACVEEFQVKVGLLEYFSFGFSLIYSFEFKFYSCMMVLYATYREMVTMATWIISNRESETTHKEP